ncbi:MAG: beta-galactosidase [Candidatus Aldehydirespiratoraceae bacterium]
MVAWDQVELRAPKRIRPAGPANEPRAKSSVDIAAIEPVLSVFRAPTDNDGYKLMPDMTAEHGIGGHAYWNWLAAGLDTADATTKVNHAHTIQVADDGSVTHRHRVVVPDALADLGRVGTQFELPAGFDQLRWFGRGPGENYPDRNRGSMLGTWEAGVDVDPYLVPQEFGLRTDCRWFEFTRSDTGEVVRLDVVAPIALHISATRCTDADLHAAAHETDLKSRKQLIVKIDVAHRGIGTASCGPDVLPQYEIPTGKHEFAYRLSAR